MDLHSGRLQTQPPTIKSERLDKIKWLEDAPKQKLLDLCRRVIADGMSPSEDDQQSQASTAEPPPYTSDVSDSDTEEEDAVVVAARNVGIVQELQADVKRFILGFVWQSDSELVDPVRSPCGQWSFCMLLWILFLKDAQYAPGCSGVVACVAAGTVRPRLGRLSPSCNSLVPSMPSHLLTFLHLLMFVQRRHAFA